MRHTRLQAHLLLLALIALIAAGCNRLQAGYYLTPGNYPTEPPTIGATPEPMTPSPTPVSTVQSLVVTTPSPEPGTAGPSTIPVEATATEAPPTETLVPCEETEGQVSQASFFSQLIGRDVRYRVYLPPCYAQTERRYPYVIMLHGLGAGMDDSQWMRMGLTSAADLGFVRGSLPPMIIVMPNGNDANYDWDAGPFPEVMLQELVPTLESTLCTWNDPQYRAIGGLSRGGYWAFWIAFTHPEMFNRIGGHSAFFYDADYASDKNPNNLVDSAPGIERLALYLDHGAEDHVVDISVRNFVERLRARGMEPEYVVNPVGAHVEDYWAAHTADYLSFYASTWPRDVSLYPSCHEPSP